MRRSVPGRQVAGGRLAHHLGRGLTAQRFGRGIVSHRRTHTGAQQRLAGVVGMAQSHFQLQRAVIDGLRVRATYTARGGAPSERVLDPVGLVHAGQAWYLMALRDGSRRTYRTSRFSAVTVLAEPARVPTRPSFGAAR